MIMSFYQEGSFVQLNGQPKPIPGEVSLHQLKSLITTNYIDTIL